MACKQCGNCCTKATFAFPEVLKVENAEDFINWFSNHSCIATVHENKLFVSVPIVCKHLVFISPGFYKCDIYNERPDICKRFLCEVSK